MRGAVDTVIEWECRFRAKALYYRCHHCLREAKAVHFKVINTMTDHVALELAHN